MSVPSRRAGRFRQRRELFLSLRIDLLATVCDDTIEVELTRVLCFTRSKRGGAATANLLFLSFPLPCSAEESNSKCVSCYAYHMYVRAV